MEVHTDVWIHSVTRSKVGPGDPDPPPVIHDSMVWQICTVLLTPLLGVVGQGQKRPLSSIPTDLEKGFFAQKKALIVNPGIISPDHFEWLGPKIVLN